MLQVINKILMLALLGFIGYVAGKTRYLPEESGQVLSKVVIKLTAPFLIVTTMAGNGNKVKLDDLKSYVLIYIFGIIFILLSYGVSIIVCRAMDLHGAAANIYKMQSMFGNVIFLSFPLIGSLGFLFGDKGIIYAIFFNLANDTILWTLGIYLVNRHNKKHWKENLKHLVNGNTIAFTVGLICMLINLQVMVKSNSSAKSVYDFLYSTLNNLGSTTIYLSMLFIGLILAEIRIGSFRDLMDRHPLFVLSAFKLILIPVTAFVVLTAMGGLVKADVRNIVVLQLAMPCATIVPALASEYRSDYRFATEGVFISTILGMGTLTLMINMIKMFG